MEDGLNYTHAREFQKRIVFHISFRYIYMNYERSEYYLMKTRIDDEVYGNEIPFKPCVKQILFNFRVKQQNGSGDVQIVLF